MEDAQAQPELQPALLDRRAAAQEGQEGSLSWKISSAAELIEASSSPPAGKRCPAFANPPAKLPTGSFWHQEWLPAQD